MTGGQSQKERCLTRLTPLRPSRQLWCGMKA